MEDRVDILYDALKDLTEVTHAMLAAIEQLNERIIRLEEIQKNSQS